MLIVAYTVRYAGGDEPDGIFEDEYILLETMEEAQSEFNKLLERDDLHCAAICSPISATEPQWLPDAPRKMIAGDIMCPSHPAALWAMGA